MIMQIYMQVKVDLDKCMSASTWTQEKSMLSNRLAEIPLCSPPFTHFLPLSLLDPHPGERLWCPSDDC